MEEDGEVRKMKEGRKKGRRKVKEGRKTKGEGGRNVLQRRQTLLPTRPLKLPSTREREGGN
jgi:hypothetical protein